VTSTLWVTNDFPPRAGGIERFVTGLLGFQDPATVRVLTSRQPGAAACDAELAYPVERIGRRPLLPTPTLRRTVQAAVAASDPDVVVFGAAWPLAALAGAVDRPTLALTHGHEAGLARFGLGRLVRPALAELDALGVISGYTEDALAPLAGDRTAVHRLPPGVDTDELRPEGDETGVRARFGLRQDQPVALCLSRLVPRKGQDVLIETWPAVRAEIPGAHLLVAGTGPLEARLRRRAASLGLAEAVTFTGGVSAAELASFYRAADVFAMPARTRRAGLDVEGLGMVYLEAQACGVPAIAGRSGGAPEAVVDGQTGRVVDGSDRRAVTAALVELLDDPQRRAAMGRAGREFVEAHYAWPVVASRFQTAIEGLVNGAE
jgi:phosphatidylinositol alpha-1,6-mannosyltransferase